MGSLDGKVAFVTGAGRGQGRSHADGLASEGADVIAIDICAPIDTIPYPLSSSEDLAETAVLVEKAGRRAVTFEVDVRDQRALAEALASGERELGGVDIVVANAGVVSVGADLDPVRVFRTVLDVDLIGVWNTIRVASPIMVSQGRGGSMILISSTAGLRAPAIAGAGGEAYVAAKHGIVGLMRTFANQLGEHGIRVNTIHPGGVDTEMVTNDAVRAYYAERAPVGQAPKVMSVDLLDPSDITQTVLYLASDASRYVTGVSLPVDAGAAVRP